jgi:hypothetical protein
MNDESRENGDINPFWESYKLRAQEVMAKAATLISLIKPQVGSNFLNLFGNLGPGPKLELTSRHPELIKSFTEEMAQSRIESCDLLMRYFELLEQYPDFAEAESKALTAAYPEVLTDADKIKMEKLKKNEQFSPHKYYIEQVYAMMNPPEEKQ